MTDFADQLAKLEPKARPDFAYANAPHVSAQEWIEALAPFADEPWAYHFAIDLLVSRGPPELEAIVEALAQADPLSRSAGLLGEALVQLFQYHQSVGPRVAAALVAATSAALDAGGGSRGASTLILLLKDCARINDGPLPEAVPVAKRLLEIAATEADPFCGATSAAKVLLLPHPWDRPRS